MPLPGIVPGLLLLKTCDPKWNPAHCSVYFAAHSHLSLVAWATQAVESLTYMTHLWVICGLFNTHQALR